MASWLSSPSATAAAVPAAGVVALGDLNGPVDGSWMAELEDAKAALSTALRGLRPDDDNRGAEPRVLRGFLRLCRAYRTLRRWDRLLVISKMGMKACAPASSSSDVARVSPVSETPSSAPASPTAEEAEASFREYRKLAQDQLGAETSLFHEQVRHYVLKLGRCPDELGREDTEQMRFPNATLLQQAVLMGDVRLMELVVALGAAIDLPIPGRKEGPRLPLPTGASALLMACAFLVASASNARDRVAECAMQLVHLGADPHRVMPRGLDPSLELFKQFEGKSAFQIAAMSNRRPLVALMWEHMQMSQLERAEVVHCRCGSRLPWKQCHSTGVGQPSHYVVDSAPGETCYRVSPLARCPCQCTNKTYYKCCWSDNRVPVYLHDTFAALLSRDAETLSLPCLGRRLRSLAAQGVPAAARVLRQFHKGSSWIQLCAPLFREHPSLFAALCDDVGPKSRMTAWDPHVYAGCVERLKVPFLWRDVHWDLDLPVLLGRSDEWNEALHKYCDDAGLKGAGRKRVVSAHAANPCGPCGYVGCSAYEGEVREFQRCAACKSISYCGRECQKKDWAGHRKACRAGPGAPAASPEFVPYEGNGRVNLGQD